ncbi:alpha/beta hydrolase [Levilactobacillus tongjiangensis]|uniref:Alpha/beta hydrolase n=1 Tax=Levilactobacillus tongjiangensis TaxID=2486023 RepID=A0ABW1SPH6_9LACO|nr:alpha/beta hydrolase [Levilactobacillus tongjiangensis]
MGERLSLEPAAVAVCEDNSAHSRSYELIPDAGRQLLSDFQDRPIAKDEVTIEDEPCDTGEWGIINVRYIRPIGAFGRLPVIFYIHGGGWVFGDSHTHDKLIRELAVRTHSVVIFPEYSLAPEAQYPTAVEQNYAVLCQTASAHGLWDASHLIVAGDGIGGNLATVMTLLAKQRKGPRITGQLLYYPVTDTDFETASYQEFGEGYGLASAGMQWFWDQYAPDQADREKSTVAPLKADQSELVELPAAMILTAEADVTRDEAEAYACRLRQVGVAVTQVRFQGMVHDFVMLNALDKTRACRAAMDLSTQWVMQQQHLLANIFD